MTNAVARPATTPSTAVHPLAAPAPSTRHINTDRVAELVSQLLVELGEDPAREGLIDTPRRVAAWWNDFLSPDDSSTATCFTESAAGDQLVVVGGMSVWSLCEHHLLPMNLQVTAGYVPEGEVVGLSKFGRIAQRHAAQLHVQERFTWQIAQELATLTGREDVAVAVRGTHLCMSMRGVRMEAARTLTMHSGGRFRTDAVLSQQFLVFATSQIGGK
ncbi:GTP cyclohydrolase I FolE [Streptomyces durbertensis]|uniref:GTP cyclohydrolase 1 n=1 Tax=Streptomyces durbertensis TaxID=2448886 RepID=A0ABR6EE93_9ACTN|nr:GTP cyclohydrolase I FolE [Streptomyces durbertensis]MBB1243578.1 GTP cyclohydrolase I FolE [Streptomyces durbertensis]